MSFFAIKIYYLLMKGVSHCVDLLMMLLSLRIVLDIKVPIVDGVLSEIINFVQTVSVFMRNVNLHFF